MSALTEPIENFCYPKPELRGSANAIVGLRPIIFGPRTLWRTLIG
jgi:hypothetical protein